MNSKYTSLDKNIKISNALNDSSKGYKVPAIKNLLETEKSVKARIAGDGGTNGEGSPHQTTMDMRD